MYRDLTNARENNPTTARAIADWYVAMDRFGPAHLRNLGAQPDWSVYPRTCLDLTGPNAPGNMLARLLGQVST